MQRFSDQEATDQATLELALQESRRLYANRDYDDLETSLLLSISSTSPSLPSCSSLAMATAASATYDRESKVRHSTGKVESFPVLIHFLWFENRYKIQSIPIS